MYQASAPVASVPVAAPLAAPVAAPGVSVQELDFSGGGGVVRALLRWSEECECDEVLLL